MNSLALLTDLYQITMAYGYWKAGIENREAVFNLYFRRWPFDGGFAIAAGLQTAIEFIQKFRFTPSDLAYLEKLQFEKPFLDFLSKFQFACDVDAFEEGSLVFPNEPFLRVRGPLWQAQLLESPMLNLLNFQTLIATKAARICMAASPDQVIEFGMRRAQGVDGAISASRAAYIGGCSATSDVIAGKMFGIPVKGTHAHSWVMAFEDEERAFETFAKVMPKNCVLLIDTYDSIEGAKKAMRVAKRLQKTGFELAGVRLDSGDLARLSIEVRRLLDEQGFFKTQIMASNELDEYLIRDLKQQGAKITVWGVGTHLVTGKGQAALDGIYKLSAIQDGQGQWQYRMKLSDQTAKVTHPGILQVRRFFDGDFYLADAVYDELLGIKASCRIIDTQDPNQQVCPSSKAEWKDLLVPVFRKGKCVYSSPSISAIQAHARQDLSRLPAAMGRFTHPQPYFTGLEQELYKKKLELIRKKH